MSEICLLETCESGFKKAYYFQTDHCFVRIRQITENCHLQYWFFPLSTIEERQKHCPFADFFHYGKHKNKAWTLLMQQEDLLKFCFKDLTIHTIKTCNKKQMPTRDYKCRTCNASIDMEWIPNYNLLQYQMDWIWALWQLVDSSYIEWIPEEVLLDIIEIIHWK
jgi:hypothetical protein